MLKKPSLLLFPLLLSSVPAFAGGFEKSVLWSGRFAGVAGAAASSVTGAESLYFNPAGLGSGPNIQVNANFSPTFGKFNGPILAANTTVESERSFSPVFGAFASYKLTEKWGLGVGTYVGGGTKADFGSISFAGVGAPFATTAASIKSDLNVVEFALGTGYEIVDGLRFGLAWRIIKVGAELGTASTSGTGAATTITGVSVKDLSDTRFNGFRLGMQYAPSESPWGVGVSWRTQVNFIAEGTSSGTITAAAGGGSQNLTGGAATIASTFPQAIDVGGHWQFMEKHRAMLQYTFIEYGKNEVLDLGGTVTLPAALGGTAVPLSDIDLWWNNQHTLRFGYETNCWEALTMRAGYAITSAAVPKERARATFSSPGLGHTFTLGAGHSILEGGIDLNGAFEYSRASGTVTTEGSLPGDYNTNVYAFHLGATLHL